MDIRRNPTSAAASNTYEFSMYIFNNGQPEELILFLKNIKEENNRNVTITSAGMFNNLHTLLFGEVLCGFYELTGQNNSTTNSHCKSIKESFLNYFTPNNDPSNQK